MTNYLIRKIFLAAILFINFCYAQQSADLDIEGNISLRGSQSVRILIDGKPAGMMGFSGPNAFKQLQGNEIDKVEIITNPSSRYSAEGSSGILNIILKKERLKGLNGSINLNTGYPTQNGISTNFNYRKSKFSVFASISLNQRETKGGGYSNSNYFLSDTTYSSSLASFQYHPISYGLL